MIGNHIFQVPVMGTGYTADSPIQLAPLGISTVVSYVDDILLEKLRKHYSNEYNLPYTSLLSEKEDGRAKRIKAYMDMLNEIVTNKFQEILHLPFGKDNLKAKYFNLLPDSFLKTDYDKMMGMEEGKEKDALKVSLENRMEPGSVDVNIMVKLDTKRYDSDGTALGDIYSDAKAALRGFAESAIKSNIVFSAGINQPLFTYMAEFKDFYRNEYGDIKKKIILKVSDFRSAMIQGKFLARKGLEVHEFRIESGLNCGGHAFPSKGNMLISVLKEFRAKRDSLAETLKPLVEKFYKKQGWVYPEKAKNEKPLMCVQGGIGTSGEVERLMNDFDADFVGIGSPYLLVPEVVKIDKDTLELLKSDKDESFFISGASPLNVLFNNLKDSGSEVWSRKRYENGTPGSPCTKSFLVSNTEFSEKPICLASNKYMSAKLAQIANSECSDEEKRKQSEKVLEKRCICDQLGNSLLIALDIAKKEKSPQCICPGPNTKWFTKEYSLQEMVDFFHGKGESIVSEERPHMMAKELELYTDYYSSEIDNCEYSKKEINEIRGILENLKGGIEDCKILAKEKPYKNENLKSITSCIEKQWGIIQNLTVEFEKKVKEIGD